MPTLNKKLLLRLLVVVLLLGGGLVALHQVQAARVPDALVWQANTAAEKGKTDKAIAYLRQYLEFRPDDHDTAVRLADLMRERADAAADPRTRRKALTNVHFLYERIYREAPNAHGRRPEARQGDDRARPPGRRPRPRRTAAEGLPRATANCSARWPSARSPRIGTGRGPGDVRAGHHLCARTTSAPTSGTPDCSSTTSTSRRRPGTYSTEWSGRTRPGRSPS